MADDHHTLAARRRNNRDETLLLTLRNESGAILDQIVADSPIEAARRAVLMLAKRPFVSCGDILTVTKPAIGGEVHTTPRELDQCEGAPTSRYPAQQHHVQVGQKQKKLARTSTTPALAARKMRCMRQCYQIGTDCGSWCQIHRPAAPQSAEVPHLPGHDHRA